MKRQTLEFRNSASSKFIAAPTRHILTMLSSTVIILIITSLLLAPVHRAQSQGVFRIGVLDDVDGRLSKGAQIAVQQANSAGGVQGADGSLFSLELVTVPTNGGVDTAAAIQTISQAGVIAVLGPLTDEEVVNNLTALQGLNVPFFTPATGDTLISVDTTGLLFRMRAAEVTQGRALADYLINVLGQRGMATVQLDTESTGGMVGFTTAANGLGVTPAPALLLEIGETTDSLIQQIVAANPLVLVAYGNPAITSEIFNGLRAAGWAGQFAYNQANDPVFRQNVPDNLRAGIIAAATWSPASPDPLSQQFVAQYAALYNAVPGSIEAASYDAVNLIIAATGQAGELRANLPLLDNIPAVQGTLSPARLNRGEISTNATVVQSNEFGGARLMARYLAGQRLPGDEVAPALAALPTATPEGVVATIATQIQNVRLGPSTAFDIIGTLNQGEVVQIIGANAENTWLVINFRGQQGWISASLPEIFGDLNSVPIVQSPPMPTPSAPPTVPPPPPVAGPAGADLVIDSVSVSPDPIERDESFTVTVNFRNAGNSAAGQFAIAATFRPDNEYASSVVGGVGAGQSGSTTLSSELDGETGSYEVAIVIDLNNQVAEDGNGESNNNYSFRYILDEDILNSGSQNLHDDDTLGLEGSGDPDDVRWSDDDGGKLVAINGAKIERMGDDYDDVFYDDIDPGDINDSEIDRDDLDDGDVIVIITGEGHRGVMEVRDISSSHIDLRFRVYE